MVSYSSYFESPRSQVLGLESLLMWGCITLKWFLFSQILWKIGEERQGSFSLSFLSGYQWSMMSLLGRGEEVRSFLPSYPFWKVTSLTKYDKSLSLFVSQTLFVGKRAILLLLLIRFSRELGVFIRLYMWSFMGRYKVFLPLFSFIFNSLEHNAYLEL